MKTGVSINDLHQRFAFDELIGKLAEIGYDCVDFAFTGTYGVPLDVFTGPRDGWVKKYRGERAVMDAAGITASQCHALYPTDFAGGQRLTDTCLDLFKKQIEAAAIIGSPYIVIHPINIALYERDKELDFERNMEAFAKLKPVLDEFGVRLGVENMFGWDGVRRRNCPTGCSLPEDMIRYIDSANAAAGGDTFVGCLDTGHMLLNCVQPASAVRKLGNRLKLLHVHDNFAVSDNHNAPGLGVTDWHAFAAALKETGYDGCFSMELSYPHFLDIDPALVWDYARYAYAAAKAIISLM